MSSAIVDSHAQTDDTNDCLLSLPINLSTLKKRSFFKPIAILYDVKKILNEKDNNCMNSKAYFSSNLNFYYYYYYYYYYR